MTALPKRRISKRRQGKRRAAIKLPLSNFTVCPECNMPKRSHQACSNCGFYKNRQVIKIKEKKKKE